MKLEYVHDLYEEDRVTSAIRDVTTELRTSTDKYGSFKTTHEACGVLMEEVDELWDACKDNDLDNMAKEAVQVAAMALRLIIDARRTQNL